MKRLLQVCKAENVTYDNGGIDAIVFTAQGDMRQVGLCSYYVFASGKPALSPGQSSKNNSNFKLNPST